jgi:RNA polymerase-binding transcription factor DksA
MTNDEFVHEVDHEEHLSDPLDVAARAELTATLAAREDHRRRCKPEQVQNEDGTWPTEDCVDCGEPIGEARLALGRVRCIDCQTKLEKRQSRGL